MFLIRRILRSDRARWATRPVAVAILAIAIGALPIVGATVAEAGSSGGGHDGGECEFSQGV